MCTSGGDHAIGIPGPQVGWEGKAAVVWTPSLLSRVMRGGGEGASWLCAQGNCFLQYIGINTSSIDNKKSLKVITEKRRRRKSSLP